MRKFIIPVLAAAVIITSASCSKNNGPSTPEAQVMFMNGWLVTSALNVTANGTTISNGTNVQFLKNTGYQNITAGTSEDVAFVLPTTSTKLIDTTVTFTANTHYSVFVSGVSPLMQIVTSDDVTAPASGMAKVRFVNLSPDTLGESLYVGANAALATGIKYGGVTAFVSIPAVASAQVIVQNPAFVSLQTTLNNQSFAAGRIYTVVLTGSSSSTGAAASTLTIMNNN